MAQTGGDAAIGDVCAFEFYPFGNAVGTDFDITGDAVGRAAETGHGEIHIAVERVDKEIALVSLQCGHGNVAWDEVAPRAIHIIQVVTYVIAHYGIDFAADGEHELVVVGAEGEFRHRHRIGFVGASLLNNPENFGR